MTFCEINLMIIKDGKAINIENIPLNKVDSCRLI